MNIIEKIQEIISEYPEISAVCNAVHIDFTDDTPTSYGLASTDDKLISEDILGNQKRQHTFLLYATFSSVNDFERLQNSTALLNLSYYLQEKTGEEIDGGMIEKITAENGMLYEVPEENAFGGWQYQMQITAEYTKGA